MFQNAERRTTDERDTNHKIGFRHFLSLGFAVIRWKSYIPNNQLKNRIKTKVKEFETEYGVR